MEIHDELEAILELLGDTTRNTVSLYLQRLKNCSFSLLLCQPYFPLVSLPPLSCARGFPLEPFPKSSHVCSPASCSSFVNGKESHGCRGVDLTYFRWQHLPALHHPTHWPNASLIWPSRIKSVYLKNQPIHLLIYKTQHFTNCLPTALPTVLLKCSGVKKKPQGIV